MSFVTRQRVCERLRLGLRQSYRIVGAAYGALLDSDDVVSMLNRARRNCDALTCMPSDLATPDEAISSVGIDGATARDLANWCRRTRNPAPHFRLNGHTIRFSTNALRAWLLGRRTA